jgi:hypothetical protein
MNDFDPFNDKQLLQAYCEANEQDYLEFVDRFMEAYNEAQDERESVEDR